MTNRTTVVKISDAHGYDGDERLFEYDKELMFPITRWLQVHRGEQVTHRMYAEFTMLTTEVSSDFLDEYDYSDEAYAAQAELFYRLDNCMLHLWDVRAELRPWIIRKMCQGLVGTRILSDLPNASIDAFNRETQYRGGSSYGEMVIDNLMSAVDEHGGPPHTEAELDEARQSNRGNMDYDIDLEPYL